ncbi:MAG: aminotransferase class I/II-fold pyridoxal phosphate-dependent enzyme [Acetobacteraceae bacterium]
MGSSASPACSGSRSGASRPTARAFSPTPSPPRPLPARSRRSSASRPSAIPRAIWPGRSDAELARIAGQHGVFVVEDEVFKPLLEDELPAVATLIPELGFFATSFTKSVMTGLRAGYLVMPPRYVLRAASVLRVTSWSAAPVIAEMAARWVENGEAEALLAVQRKEIAARQALATEALGEALVHPHPNALSAWVALPAHWSEGALVRTLFGRGVAVASSDPFVADPAHRHGGIRICLGGRMSEARLSGGLETIRQTLAQIAPVSDAGLLA